MAKQNASRTAGLGASPVQVTIADLVRWQARANKLPTRRQFRARAALAGQHQSRFRGRGVDYLESRHYLPGDDIRNMDWRVTARTGRAHTKVFQEERERPVVLLLDRNPSMYFATRGVLKSVMAAHLAALLAWSTVRSGDRIGGFAFGGEQHHELEPAGGRRGAMRLIKPLVEWMNPPSQKPERETLATALGRLRRVARPGTLVVILSDFYHQDEELERQLSRLRQHNDVMACQILDPIEARGLPLGSYPVTDGEQQQILQLRNQHDFQRQQEQLQAAYGRTPELLRRHGCRTWVALTTDDPLDALWRGTQSQAAAAHTAIQQLPGGSE
jgi:uncharacterized protein (DUF58 family)